VGSNLRRVERSLDNAARQSPAVPGGRRGGLSLVVSIEAGSRSRALRTPPVPTGLGHGLPTAHDTHNIASLAIWHRKLRSVEFAVRAPATSQPNPLVVDSLVVA